MSKIENAGSGCSEILCNEQELAKSIKDLSIVYDKNDLLIPVLKHARDIYGCLTQDVQGIVAKHLNVSIDDVEKAAKFYPEPRSNNLGKYNISVCMGTACYVKGAGKVLDKLKSELGINAETDTVTEDGLFSIDVCRCVGACGLAPLILVNDDVYGYLKAEDIPEILDKYRKLG